MATTKTKTKAELEAELQELKELIKQLSANQNAAQPVQPVYQQPVTVVAPNNDITIVYMSDSLGYAKISNMELNFNRYGEQFTLTRYQFDELVGKYRSWFDRGILAVSYNNLDAAIAKGVKTDADYNLDYKKLEKIGSMTCDQLEKLWNENTTLEHKRSIVSFMKRKFIEDVRGYKDRAKIDLMNRLTDGGFQRESDELSGRYKIAPTVM